MLKQIRHLATQKQRGSVEATAEAEAENSKKQAVLCVCW